jgi:hypothetical protein
MKKPVDAMIANRVRARVVGIPGILPATETYEGGIGATPNPKMAYAIHITTSAV